MPKLKPLSKPEDMAAVPLNEPILVSLEPLATGAEPDDAVLEQSQDDGSKQLQAQLDILKAAEKTQKDRADAAEAREREARQQAVSARTERDTSEHDLLVGSLQSAQSDLTSAKAEMAAAYERADGPAIAEANAKIARASSRIVSFEGAVAELEARKTQQPKLQDQPQRQSVDPVTAINTNPNLMPKEREWLIAHQDAYIDPQRNNELSVVYQQATREGYIRGTPEYFEYLDQRMGYKKPQRDEERQTTNMSAPVSRESQSMNNGNRSPNQITLTPEERDMAKSMGLTDIAYARQKLNLQVDKRQNPERYGRTS